MTKFEFTPEISGMIFKTLPDPAALLDDKGNVILVNPAWEKYIQRDESKDMFGNKQTNYLDALRSVFRITDEAAAQIYVGLQAVLLGKNFKSRFYSQKMDKWFDFLAVALPYQEPRVFVVHRNITEQVRIELARADTIRMVTHDVKGPITVIKARCRQIQKFGDDITKRLNAVRAIDGNCDRIDAILDDLEGTYQLEQGEEPRVEPVDFGKLVAEKVVTLLPESEQSRLHWENEYPVVVLAEEERLVRVVRNIVENALKYSVTMPVVLELTANDKFGKLEVRDQGPGIPIEDLPHIFERGYRSRSTKHIVGRGLGLFGGHLFVKSWGGELTVVSEQGKGSTFTLLLLLAGSDN